MLSGRRLRLTEISRRYDAAGIERLEMFLYRKAARIVSVTESFKRVLVRRGIDGSKIEVVTNGVDISRFKPRPKDPELTRQLGLEGKFVAGYIGTHGMAHALETLVEAAACGLPVVASRHGPMPELVRHEGTGLLFEPGNVAALSAALRRVLQDPAAARAWGQAARVHQQACWSAEANYQHLLKLYGDLKR